MILFVKNIFFTALNNKILLDIFTLNSFLVWVLFFRHHDFINSTLVLSLYFEFFLKRALRFFITYTYYFITCVVFFVFVCFCKVYLNILCKSMAIFFSAHHDLYFFISFNEVSYICLKCNTIFCFAELIIF